MTARGVLGLSCARASKGDRNVSISRTVAANHTNGARRSDAPHRSAPPASTSSSCLRHGRSMADLHLPRRRADTAGPPTLLTTTALRLTQGPARGSAAAARLRRSYCARPSAFEVGRSRAPRRDRPEDPVQPWVVACLAGGTGGASGDHVSVSDRTDEARAEAVCRVVERGAYRAAIRASRRTL
jgi:hypothetical protein